jgi:hypothetical protein
MFVMAYSLNLNSVSGINMEERVFCERNLVKPIGCVHQQAKNLRNDDVPTLYLCVL